MVLALASAAPVASADVPGDAIAMTRVADDDDDTELDDDDGAKDDDPEFEPDTVEKGAGDRKPQEGSSENPGELPEFGTREKRRKAAPSGYPLELVRRPLTLASGMSEILLDIPTNISPYQTRGHLEAAYGITNQIEIRVAYAPGAVDADGFTTGKTIALEGRYLITDWLSVRASLPMLLEPFAMGVTLGAPVKFQLGDKLAFIGGHDFLSFLVNSFVPLIDDPLGNAALVDAESNGTILDRGALRFLAGVIYQVSPKTAFIGEIGVVADDFALTDAGLPLSGKLHYSPTNKIDLAASIGFERLDNATTTFALTVLAGFRI